MLSAVCYRPVTDWLQVREDAFRYLESFLSGVIRKPDLGRGAYRWRSVRRFHELSTRLRRLLYSAFDLVPDSGNTGRKPAGVGELVFQPASTPANEQLQT